jgi:hypothetical protein
MSDAVEPIVGDQQSRGAPARPSRPRWCRANAQPYPEEASRSRGRGRLLPRPAPRSPKGRLAQIPPCRCGRARGRAGPGPGGVLPGPGRHPDHDDGHRAAVGRPDHPGLCRVLRRVSRRNPDVTVALDVVPYADYFAALPDTLAAGTADDVSWLNSSYFGELADRGALMNIDRRGRRRSDYVGLGSRDRRRTRCYRPRAGSPLTPRAARPTYRASTPRPSHITASTPGGICRPSTTTSSAPTAAASRTRTARSPSPSPGPSRRSSTPRT